MTSRKANCHNAKISINKECPDYETLKHSKTTGSIIKACLSKFVKAVVIYFITNQFFSGKSKYFFFPSERHFKEHCYKDSQFLEQVKADKYGLKFSICSIILLITLSKIYLI